MRPDRALGVALLMWALVPFMSLESEPLDPDSDLAYWLRQEAAAVAHVQGETAASDPECFERLARISAEVLRLQGVSIAAR